MHNTYTPSKLLEIFILSKNGETLIKINYEDKDKNYSFKLENKRNLDRKSLNLLINKEISAIIN